MADGPSRLQNDVVARRSQVDQRLIQLGIVIGGTERFLSSAAPGDVWMPAAGSPAAEMRRVEAEVSPDDFGWSSIAMILMAMLDHMNSLRTLLQPGNISIFGASVITRSCLEAAARLRWIAESGTSASESVQRVHRLRCSGLAYQVAMHEQFDADPAVVASRKEYLDTAEYLARQHGATSLRAPGHTALVRELFADPATPHLGAGIYNLLSGICHASPPALIEFFQQGTPPAWSSEDDALFVQPTITVEQVELSVQLAAYGVSRTLDELLPFAGWPTDLWPNWQRRLLSCAFRVAGTEHTGQTQ